MSGKAKETAVVSSVHWQRALRGSVAVAALTVMSTAAQAQCVSSGATGDVRGLLGVASGTTINTITSAITTSNTAFLTQSTAFVGAPGNPKPNQQGGGVWGRAIGGQIDTKNTSTTSNVTLGGAAIGGNVVCNTSTQLDFAGFQVGTDLGKFNVNGWNFHYGATAGYLAAKAKDKTAPNPTMTNNLEIPFAGVYAAATRGGFFIDGQVRFDAYQNELNDGVTGNGFFNQYLHARSVSVAGNIGYNHVFANNWFVEPSAGFIWSRTQIDPFSFSGSLVLATSPGIGAPGTLTIDDINSLIGRASVRVGTIVQAGNWILTPFVTGSVYHEFGDAMVANYRSNFTALGGAFPEFTARTSTSTLGTWGQVALGIAGQMPSTGWVWYARGDYRFGENIDGWSLNGGLRYHYTPEPLVASKMPTKGPAIPASTAVNWTGFYIGASVGGVFAQQEVSYTGLALTDDPRVAGVAGGGQFGYNWQRGKWIFGVEADGLGSNARGGKSCNGGVNNFAQVFFTCAGEIDWLVSGTGKVGYAFWDRAYIYAKGGVIAGDVTFQARCNTGSQPTLFVTPAGCPVSTDSKTAVGWTIGWGTEFALTQNWSVRKETRYFDLGTETLRHAQQPGAFANPRVQTDGWVSTVGVNYRFGGRS